MITAIVMVTAARQHPEVAQAIADLDGVSEVYSVAGHVDIVAVVRVREFEQVRRRDRWPPGQVCRACSTPKHIAFRAYRGTTLEAAFAIGFDETDRTGLDWSRS